MYKYCLINQTSRKTKPEIYLSINTVATAILTSKGSTLRPSKEVEHLMKIYIFSLIQLHLNNN